MAFQGEPSDSGNNWVPDGNPSNTQETGETGGGPDFLELPTYSISKNTIRFMVKEGQELTIIIMWNEKPKLEIEHKHWYNNRYNFESPLGYGNYHVKLIDAQGGRKMKPATFT